MSQFNTAQFNTNKFNHFTQTVVLEWRLYRYPNTSFETLVASGTGTGEEIEYGVLMPGVEHRLVFNHTLIPEEWDVFFITPSFGVTYDALGG